AFAIALALAVAESHAEPLAATEPTVPHAAVADSAVANADPALAHAAVADPLGNARRSHRDLGTGLEGERASSEGRARLAGTAMTGARRAWLADRRAGTSAALAGPRCP